MISKTQDRAPARPLQVVMALFVVLVGAVVFIAATSWLFGSLARLEDGLAQAIILGSVTVLVALANRRWEHQRELTKELRIRRTPVYERLTSGWIDMFISAGPEGVSEELVVRYFRDVTPPLPIWASDDVLRAWAALRSRIVQGGAGADGEAILHGYARLILTIRRDLGYKNKDLDTRHVLALFINDIDMSGDRPLRAA